MISLLKSVAQNFVRLRPNGMALSCGDDNFQVAPNEPSYL